MMYSTLHKHRCLFRRITVPSVWLVLLACLLWSIPASAAITIQTRFEPPRIALGDTARYIVDIVETSESSLPVVERINTLPIQDSGGLSLRNGRTSTSQQTRFVNGQSEFQITQSLVIDAQAPGTGEFTIPGFVIEYKGQTLEAPAATLSVLERTADAAPTVDELIFLRLDVPETLYVGQSTPLTVKLYLAEEVRLSGLYAFDRKADGFTLSPLPDQAREGSEIVNGRRYRVLSWSMAATPVSSGPQPLNFQFTLTAQVPGSESNRDPFGRRSPLGSSLLDSFFGRSERFNIYTEPTTVEVRPLPRQGQPDSFSGAIGDFSMEASTDAEIATVGEPIMLSLRLSGRGNFSRISGPALKEHSDWRHFPPEEKFEAADELGLRGSKRFDYIFVPEKSGMLELPEVRFSFFDPETKEYFEMDSPPIAVEVAPGTRIVARPPSASSAPGTGTQQAAPALLPSFDPEAQLLTLDYRPKPARPVDGNPLNSSAFYVSNGLAALALLGAALVLRQRRRLRTDSAYAAARQLQRDYREAVAALEAAASQGDSQAFYQSVQLAIRLAATRCCQHNLRSSPPESLTQALAARGISKNTQSSILDLFAQADAFRFSGTHAEAGTQLSKIHAQVKSTLEALK